MNRNVLIAVCLLASHAIAREPAVLEKSFKTKTATYKMSVRAYDLPGEPYVLFHYDVYKNGAILMPHGHGGVAVGCKMFARLTGEVASLELLKIKGVSVGWTLYTAGICGNTFSSEIILVIPHADEYVARTLIAKEEPIIRVRANKLEIWYCYQEWGEAGTAGSIFVPELIIVDPRQDSIDNIITRGDVFGILRLDTKAWEDYESNFLALFTAGLRDLNIRLMQYAVENLYKAKDRQWYEWFFGGRLPTSRAELSKFVQELKRYKQIEAKIGRFRKP